MGITIYTEEFIKDFIENKGYTFIGFGKGGYKGVKSRVIVWCGNPNHEPYEVIFEKFKGYKNSKGTRCKLCRFWTEDKIIKFIEDEGYTVIKIIKYDFQNTRVLIWCGNPEHKPYEVTFSVFKGRNNRRGSRCPYCNNERKSKDLIKWTKEAIIEYVESQGYEFIEFINFSYNLSRIKIWCKNINHKPYEVRFDAFARGTRCRECHNDNVTKWTKEKIIEYVELQGYKFIEFIEFNKYTSKIKVWCGNLNHKPFEVYFSNFENKNSRCPECNLYKGEEEISNVLTKYNIKFKIQYKFDNCKCNRKLPFDFYLPYYNACIEFDGGQHYFPVKWFGGIDGFIETKIRDTIKTWYCEQNDIKLIRIPYYEFDNIEEILVKELNLNKID